MHAVIQKACWWYQTRSPPPSYVNRCSFLVSTRNNIVYVLGVAEELSDQWRNEKDVRSLYLFQLAKGQREERGRA